MMDYITRKREDLLGPIPSEPEIERLMALADLYYNPLLSTYTDPYRILADLLEAFGILYLLPLVKELFPEPLPSVVDFGAGTGWLGAALAEGGKAFCVDKRSLAHDENVLYSSILDLDQKGKATQNAIRNITEYTDLSVVCEVLHCICPAGQLQLLKNISSEQLLVIEQLPVGRTGMIAEQQIAKASGQPLLSRSELQGVLDYTNWLVEDTRSIYHYVILKCKRG